MLDSGRYGRGRDYQGGPALEPLPQLLFCLNPVESRLDGVVELVIADDAVRSFLKDPHLLFLSNFDVIKYLEVGSRMGRARLLDLLEVRLGKTFSALAPLALALHPPAPRVLPLHD